MTRRSVTCYHLCDRDPDSLAHVGTLYRRRAHHHERELSYLAVLMRGPPGAIPGLRAQVPNNLEF